MNGFGVLMLILAAGVILCGLYLYTGHNSDLLLWKAPMKNPSKEDLQYVGGITMFVALSPLITGIVALIADEESSLPVFVFFGSAIAVPLIAAKLFKKKDNEGEQNGQV